MIFKKIFVFLVLAILSPPTVLFAWQTFSEETNQEKQKYQQLNKIVYDFYNNFESKENNAQNLKEAWTLLQQYSDDPYLYDLWATVEWVLVGHELGVGLDQRKSISESPEFSDRFRRYYEIVNKGLELTENKENTKYLFARAVLFFDQAKFTYRFGDGVNALTQADKETAKGIKTLKIVLRENSNFCSAYFFLGATRYGFAAKTEPWSPKRIIIKLSSHAYDELYYMDDDVFNKSASLEWIERTYNCRRAETWLKKSWLESVMLLAGVYENQRKEFKTSAKTKNEWLILEKEVPLLEELTSAFPNRKDLSERLKSAKPRLKILKNYFYSTPR